MKVILYIGHHKVGSTSLQVFLSQNFLGLARHGILYPSVETQGAARFLARAVKGRDRAEVLPVNAREPHSALAYRMMAHVSPRTVPPQFVALPHQNQMFHAIRHQAAQLAPDCIVLCSEAFANFGAVDPELVTRLTDLFPGAEFQIYCALRRPDEYLVSWHGQRLKVGERLEPLRTIGPLEYLDGIHFDYRLMLEAWRERCAGATFTIRNYADVLAAGGSIDDFVAQAVADFPDDLLPAEKANPSLPHAVMEIVRQGNRALEPKDAHALVRFLLRRAGDLDLVPNGRIEMYGPENRALIAEHFAPIHDHLSEVTQSPAFFPDIDEIARPRPVPEIEAMEAALDQFTPGILEDLPSDPARTFLSDLQSRRKAG